ncbi:hypothetical protein PQR62_07145 [Herbaspirillum lusitanum]|uniref:Fe2OG dioxygenase domain-containing protein n=1 Tax=Herbaspirillum lusitanum TaxID=213312 RepID=A0ABW9A8N6_9BURK
MFFTAALPVRISPPLFNHYGDEHNFLNDHGDVALRFLPEAGCVRSDLSCTLFLSEPEEYEGGELVIADVWRDEAVKLAAGDLLFDPDCNLMLLRSQLPAQERDPAIVGLSATYHKLLRMWAGS